MNSLHVPMSRLCVETLTDATSSQSPYTVRLAIAEQPVKPSRKSLHRVSVELMRDGHAAASDDIAVQFHPMDARQPRLHPMGELVLTRPHRRASSNRFEASLALEAGHYRVDVTIDHRIHAGFLIHM